MTEACCDGSTVVLRQGEFLISVKVTRELAPYPFLQPGAAALALRRYRSAAAGGALTASARTSEARRSIISLHSKDKPDVTEQSLNDCSLHMTVFMSCNAVT